MKISNFLAIDYTITRIILPGILYETDMTKNLTHTSMIKKAPKGRYLLAQGVSPGYKG